MIPIVEFTDGAQPGGAEHRHDQPGNSGARRFSLGRGVRHPLNPAAGSKTDYVEVST
jgi:hypothetical protein